MNNCNGAFRLTSLYNKDGHNVCYILVIGKYKILLNIGAYNLDWSYLEKHIEEIKNIDFILLSHYDLRFTGGLPFLTKNGCFKPTYATSPIFELSKICINELNSDCCAEYLVKNDYICSSSIIIDQEEQPLQNIQLNERINESNLNYNDNKNKNKSEPEIISERKKHGEFGNSEIDKLATVSYNCSSKTSLGEFGNTQNVQNITEKQQKNIKNSLSASFIREEAILKIDNFNLGTEKDKSRLNANSHQIINYDKNIDKKNEDYESQKGNTLLITDSTVNSRNLDISINEKERKNNFNPVSSNLYVSDFHEYTDSCTKKLSNSNLSTNLIVENDENIEKKHIWTKNVVNKGNKNGNTNGLAKSSEQINSKEFQNKEISTGKKSKNTDICNINNSSAVNQTNSFFVGEISTDNQCVFDNRFSNQDPDNLENSIFKSNPTNNDSLLYDKNNKIVKNKVRMTFFIKKNLLNLLLIK
ncbi:hypothetical protein EDEG_03238 [Edhazardia aedis USNM 41457]|uniref:Metallo-beta-lactamase domain-containing protein n=1 Tax=Edhazardia aedis (strain USNM 41457) TaxID=1003232 RepID=J9D3B4_EDHAE|nr:hypothetical protein EDEG_03238 [Edhazardia aedis USNM 41457]|eukprot:EJW02336.1 hypothetical protein EDEG_03238 [Edhazardia aedis USNM 41457]